MVAQVDRHVPAVRRDIQVIPAKALEGAQVDSVLLVGKVGDDVATVARLKHERVGAGAAFGVVVAGPAMECIVAPAAAQRICALAAMELVEPGVAVERVGARKGRQGVGRLKARQSSAMQNLAYSGGRGSVRWRRSSHLPRHGFGRQRQGYRGSRNGVA